jgi:hypothetical protein
LEQVTISTSTNSPASNKTGPGGTLDRLGRFIDGCGQFLKNDRIALAIPLALLIGTFVAQLLSNLNHDTAWYIYAGTEFLDGGELYRDVFVDVNPPLGFFLTLPPVILAYQSGLFAIDLFVVYFFLLIVVSLGVTWRLLCVDRGLSLVTRRGLMILATLILTICPAGDFGQREHFLMVFVLPYLLLNFLTARGVRLSWFASLGIGLVAGLGFVLKPHFLLVPLALEAYRFATTRRWQAILRSEVLGLAATLVVYIAVVAWIAPDYLTRIVPYALEIYNQTYQNPLWFVLRRAETVLLPVGCFVHLSTRRKQNVPQLGDVFMIASAVFFVAYVTQMKGWSYHLYPASSCLILGYGALFLDHLADSQHATRLPGDRSLTRRMAVASLVLAASLTVHAAIHLRYKNPYTYSLTPYVERYAQNGSIAVLGSNVWAGFPMVNYSRVGWSSRFSTLWLLPGIIRKRSNGDLSNPALLDEIETFIRESVVADLTTEPPDVIFVDDRSVKSYFGDVPFDYLAYFRKDPRFALLWSNYTWVAEEEGFDIYRRYCAPDC